MLSIAVTPGSTKVLFISVLNIAVPFKFIDGFTSSFLIETLKSLNIPITEYTELNCVEFAKSKPTLILVFPYAWFAGIIMVSVNCASPLFILFNTNSLVSKFAL